MQLFAKEVNSWIAGQLPDVGTPTLLLLVLTLNTGSQVVMYGRSRPEYHRIAALQGQLPASVPASTYSFYEPMNAFMDKIFTRNPKEEMDPNGRVYIPTFALTYLLKRLEKIEKQEYAAFRPLTIPPLEVARGK